MNQLKALAMNEGRRWKSKLWGQQGRAEFEKLALAPWATGRRRELLELFENTPAFLGHTNMIADLSWRT